MLYHFTVMVQESYEYFKKLNVYLVFVPNNQPVKVKVLP